MSSTPVASNHLRLNLHQFILSRSQSHKSASFCSLISLALSFLSTLTYTPETSQAHVNAWQQACCLSSLPQATRKPVKPRPPLLCLLFLRSQQHARHAGPPTRCHLHHAVPPSAVFPSCPRRGSHPHRLFRLAVRTVQPRCTTHRPTH